MSTAKIEEKRSDKSICAPSKSMESLYSFSSSNSKSMMLQRRKSSLSKTSEVRQRVISARMLRFKNLQNQLADALQHISALTNENRLLKTLHKRQDNALAKYEGTNAELPQLLHSHAEELRVWNTKYRALNSRNRELNAQLKQKEEMILKLSERNKHLTQLSEDKNLEIRETLTGKVHYLELRVAEKDEQIKMLLRRNNLETKNFKAQLLNEQKKYKMLCQKMENASPKMKPQVSVAEMFGDDMIRSRVKSNSSLLPRLIQKKNRSDDDDASTTPSSSQKQLNASIGSKINESRSDSDDNEEESAPNERKANRRWFSRDDYSEDDDLIIRTVPSEEEIAEKSLTNHFSDMKLEGVDSNECIDSDQKCCVDKIGDGENGIGEGESAGCGDNPTFMCRTYPKRTPLDEKKKNQLLAALRVSELHK